MPILILNTNYNSTLLPSTTKLTHQVLLCFIASGLIGSTTSLSFDYNGLDTEFKSSCSIFKHLGANDLSINDIVVKSSVTNVACIKARFSLAMKVEALVENTALQCSNDPAKDQQQNCGDKTGSDLSRIVLGYLPLDNVVSVEDSCPLPPIKKEDGQKSDKTAASESDKSAVEPEPQELSMIISFECGNFIFHFKREENFYVSSIEGVVKLDSNTNRYFVTEKPMFFTSDLTHHFKFNELIEVDSALQSKAYILTANFYNSEFEVFRNTSSRDFIRPPDEQSKPFQE